MGNWRAERTVLNWRWWAILPLIVALLPVILLDLILAGITLAGGAAESGRDLLSTFTRYVTKPCFGWARANLTKDRQHG